MGNVFNMASYVELVAFNCASLKMPGHNLEIPTHNFECTADLGDETTVTFFFGSFSLSLGEKWMLYITI